MRRVGEEKEKRRRRKGEEKEKRRRRESEESERRGKTEERIRAGQRTIVGTDNKKVF